MAQSEGTLVLCSGQVDHARVVTDVAGQGVSLDVGAILPLGGVWGACARDAQVVMFDLVLEY